MLTNEEKRKNIRLSINLKVLVEFNDGSKYKGLSNNVSFGGMFVTFKQKPKIKTDDVCEIALVLQEDEDQVDILLKAKVAHCKDDGVGFQFIRIDIDYYERFKSLMIMNSGNPDKLIDELESCPGLFVDK